MNFRLALSINPNTKAKMPTIVPSPSPIPMPNSASKTPVYSQKLPSKRPSPIYSQRPPSKSTTPSYRPHIMPIRKADMIPSYSASASASPSSAAHAHSHSLLISSLQGLGVIGILMLVAMILWAIRGEINRNRRLSKKSKAEFTQSELIIQQINPTAYSKLNLIRRASSNSLNSSGNISPV